MLNHETESPPRAVPPASVLTAVRWAVEVATVAPEALHSAPPAPSAEELKVVAVASFRDDLDRLLLGRHTQEGLDALLLVGLLEAWLPEVHAMVGFGDGEWRHKDVWKHTKQVVWQSVPRLEVRWGALLHDIGKIKTRSVEPTGEVHFFGHSEVGASMFRKRVAARLGIEGDLYHRVHFLILNHLRASQYDGSWTDSAVRRFSREMGDGLTDLLDLSRADITTKRPEKKKKGLRQISEIGDRIERLLKEDAKIVPLPKGLGTAISERFGVPPSKRLGDLRKRLEDLVGSGDLQAQQSIEHYLDFIDAHRSDFGL